MPSAAAICTAEAHVKQHVSVTTESLRPHAAGQRGDGAVAQQAAHGARHTADRRVR
ncbi:hypothetical protein ACU4GD_33185 [Cupriavidus basilensis]